MTIESNSAVLLYDGLCGFCDGSVQFILARDQKRTLRFAALQGDFARALVVRFPELREVDSLVLVRPATDTSPELLFVRSAAVLQLARYLGGGWAVLGSVLRLVPRFIRDWAYDVFARIRYRVFGRRAECRIPSALERSRFLD